MRLLLLVLTLTLLAAGIPAGVTHASSSDDVTITANTGNASEYCPFDFSITAVSPYEIQLEWQNATGNTTQSTVVRAAYGRLPEGPDDGFAVYSGNDTDYTHWVNTEFIDVDVYYRLYTLFDDGEYSICYAEGFVSGGIGMTELASNVELGIILFIPGLLIVISFWRRNIIAYIAAIISIGLTLPEVQNSLGTYVLAPMIVIMIGIALMALYDATIGKGIRV